MDSSSLPVSAPGAFHRLLIVDDHPVVRSGLRAIEDIDTALRIVGEAETIENALLRFEELSPDLVLLDIRLQNEDGLEVCRHVKAVDLDVGVLCLTSFADNHFVLAALEAGADGYVLKQRDAGFIAHAIREVLSGRSVFDPLIAGIAEAGSGAPSPQEGRLNSLSPGENRVLAGVAQGWTDKEVAASLGLSVKTVRNCLDRVFAKLNVHTRTGAAMIYAGSKHR